MNEFATNISRHWEADTHIRVPTQPSQVLLWITNTEGAAQFLSPSWSRFTGRDRNELMGAGWLGAMYPEDLPCLKDTFQRATTEAQGFRRKLQLRRHDGIHCSMVIEGLPRLDDQGRTEGFAGFCLDLSPADDPRLSENLADHRITDLLRQIRLAALAIDLDGRILFFNQSFVELVGDPPREIVCRPFFGRYAEIPPPDPIAAMLRHPSELPQQLECLVKSTDAKNHLVNWHITVLRRENGRPTGIILIGDDITERRTNEEKLLLTHRVFETTDQAMVLTDSEARIISVNQAFSRLTGYTRAEAVGQNPRILQSGRHTNAFYEHMWHSLRESGHWHGDIWDRRKDGSFYPKFLSISAIRDAAGRVTHYCGMFYDITERKAIEEKLDRLAHYDTLTGLPNRSLLFDRMEQAISGALRNDTAVALLFIDLDHFKAVNDALGHDAGDQLLRQVAERLGQCVRAHDTVARLGGDEFVVVLPDVRETASVLHVANKILALLALPFGIENHSCAISPSIGISLYPADHHNPEQLLQQADRAMYRVKANGRSNCMFYHDLALDDAR